MAILIKPLSSTQVQNAKPQAGKTFALRDGDGLYLEVSPSGSKIWRMKYKKTDGKDGRLTFGEPEFNCALFTW